MLGFASPAWMALGSVRRLRHRNAYLAPMPVLVGLEFDRLTTTRSRPNNSHACRSSPAWGVRRDDGRPRSTSDQNAAQPHEVNVTSSASWSLGSDEKARW